MSRYVKEKWVKVGIGAPRKYTHRIQKPWYSGTINVKQTLKLLQMLHSHGYHHVTWALQPNKFFVKGQDKNQWPYHFSMGYTGMSEE